MSPFDVCIWAVLCLFVLFLSLGLAFIVFGKRVPSSDRIEITIYGQSIKAPYSIGIALCIIGLILFFLWQNLWKGGEPPSPDASLKILTEAYAQTPSTFPQGWVYFGDESDPQHWNFQIIGGSYADLRSRRPGLLLKSLKDITVRESHFGNFTGTVFQFLDPEPTAIGTMPRGTCGEPRASVSVGKNKIWVQVVPAACTS